MKTLKLKDYISLQLLLKMTKNEGVLQRYVVLQFWSFQKDIIVYNRGDINLKKYAAILFENALKEEKWKFIFEKVKKLIFFLQKMQKSPDGIYFSFCKKYIYAYYLCSTNLSTFEIMKPARIIKKNFKKLNAWLSFYSKVYIKYPKRKNKNHASKDKETKT